MSDALIRVETWINDETVDLHSTISDHAIRRRGGSTGSDWTIPWPYCPIDAYKASLIWKQQSNN